MKRFEDYYREEAQRELEEKTGNAVRWLAVVSAFNGLAEKVEQLEKENKELQGRTLKLERPSCKLGTLEEKLKYNQ